MFCKALTLHHWDSIAGYRGPPADDGISLRDDYALLITREGGGALAVSYSGARPSPQPHLPLGDKCQLFFLSAGTLHQ